MKKKTKSEGFWKLFFTFLGEHPIISLLFLIVFYLIIVGIFQISSECEEGTYACYGSTGCFMVVEECIKVNEDTSVCEEEWVECLERTCERCEG